MFSKENRINSILHLKVQASQKTELMGASEIIYRFSFNFQWKQRQLSAAFRTFSVMFLNYFIRWPKLRALIQNMAAVMTNYTLRQTNYPLPYMDVPYLMIAK
jgi:hypothetical protein